MSKKYKYAVCALFGAAFIMLVLFFVVGEPTKEYNIVFDTNGGSDIPAQTVIEGKRIIKPNNPVKENSNFIRWEYNHKEYDFNSAVNENMTLEAIWEAKEELKYYDIEFTVNGVTKKLSLSALTEETIAELGFEEKSGYELKWYLNDQEYIIGEPLTGNMSLVGKYVKVTTYTVKFNSDGGTAVTSQKVNPNEKATEPAAITKYGFIFEGWYLNNSKYDFNTPVTSNITLKAKWSEDPNVKRYEVTFNSDGGTAVASQRVIENEKATEPKAPTKTDHKFLGWFLNDNKYDFKTKVTSDITLVAKWEEIIKFTVTFDKDNGTPNETKTVISGEKVAKPANPTRDGYKFSAWLLDNREFDFNTPITKDITLTASYTVLAKYIVTFDSNGGSSVSSQTVYEGGKATQPSNPTKTDNDFVEWQLNGNKYNFDTVVTGNITLVAKWQLKEADYKVQVTRADAFSPESYLKVFKNNQEVPFNDITCKKGSVGGRIQDGSYVAANGDIEDCGGVFTVILTSGTSVRATLK